MRKPYSFVAGAQQMMKGFDEAMFFLRKGTVAKLYIPSTLAYGPTSNNPNIKAFEHLIFDIELLNIQDKAPMATQPPPQQKIDVPQQKK
jgi:FKBP-type peptidyl-prolyl cis-trans isomerase